METSDQAVNGSWPDSPCGTRFPGVTIRAEPRRYCVTRWSETFARLVGLGGESWEAGLL